MTQSNKHLERYLAVQVETATPGRLVLMLYDAALKRLHHAAAAMESAEFESAHIHLLRVQDILIELIISIDHQQGGDIAANLHRLYEYMYRSLVQANVQRATEPIRHVALMLTDLRSAWAQALTAENATAPPEPWLLAAGAENMTAVAPPGSRLNLQG